MSASNVNYRENFFQHPELTKIHGDPTYSTLAKLDKECKGNAKSVASTLGGGQQGHLGLVSSVTAYMPASLLAFPSFAQSYLFCPPTSEPALSFK